MLTIDQVAAILAFLMLFWTLLELWPAVRHPINRTVSLFSVGMLFFGAAWIVRSAYWDGWNAYVKQYNPGLLEWSRWEGSFVINPLASAMVVVGAACTILAVRRAKRGQDQ